VRWMLEYIYTNRVADLHRCVCVCLLSFEVTILRLTSVIVATSIVPDD
jgi:hypothetical protein